MLSNELEHCLVEAFREAREARRAQVTMEHLLLAIIDAPKVREILGACHCDVAKLKQELEEHVSPKTPRPDETEERELLPRLESQPSLDLQRVLQRAVFHVKSSGKNAVGVADVLVAIFSEKQSRGVYLLNRHNVTRTDVVTYISQHRDQSSSMRIGAIVIRTPEFDRTVAFWREALHYVPQEPASADCVVLRDPAEKGPNLAFQARDRSPRSRSWVHLDLYARDQWTEVERLLKLGARRYPWRYPAESDFVVLEDPGGNLFCVVAKPDDR